MPRFDRIALGTCLAIGLMALIVLVGWHAHVPAAVQIFEGLVPMQYNTALCFLALGAGGAGLLTRRRWLLAAGGSFVLLMGAAVVAEYVTGISLGIDTFFFYPWVQSLSAHPGRMAITTAISFVLTGGALVRLAARRDAYAVLGIVNSIPLSLALTSLIGYALQVAYVLPFNLGTQMALHTSVAFLAYCIVMLAFAWRYAPRAADGMPRWGAGIGVAFLPVFLVGASAIFPEQTWRIVPLEALLAVGGVALITFAVQRMARAKVTYKGLLMITLPLGLLLVFVALVQHQKRESELALSWARHSEQLVGVSKNVLGGLAEAESALRGYAISGNDTFLTSYATAAASAEQAVTAFRHLAADNPGQDAHAQRIALLADDKLRRLSATVALARAGDTQQVNARMKGEIGSDLMARIRTEMGVFSQEEGRLRAVRRQTVDASWQRFSWLLVAGTAAQILLATILTVLFTGSIGRRLELLRNNAISFAAGEELAAPLTGEDEIADLDRVFHEMAESLDELTRREKEVIGGTTDAVFIRDLDHRFLMINQGGADLIGKTVQELIGTSVYDVFDRPSADRIAQRDDALLARGATETYELLLMTKAGVERTYLGTAWPYRDRRGRVVGVIGISRDITDRKQIAAELEQARDAAWESVRLKGEFLANMSHEIRTPMNGVIGMTGLLLETTLSAQQRDYTDTIQSSAEGLLTIINDILDFSKIEAGLMRFEKIDFDLRGTVEATVQLLAERAHSKGLELASLVDREVPTALTGDPGRLRQVLMNLIGNAVKFTDRGEVVIKVTKVSGTEAAAVLRFEIADTGIGISADAQRGLFQPFTQADGSTTRKYGGTGLGLAISRQLVELMYGEIGIESTPGAGSTFWFTARFGRQPAPAAAGLAPASTLSGARVLIVDDNATNRTILDHQTTSWGMIASQAESGPRALELLRTAVARAEPFAIAVLDLMLPGMDGFELADAIKADPTIAPVVLVLLPSFGQRGHDERALHAGIAAFLEKPVRQSQLYDCLSAALAGSAPDPLAAARALPPRPAAVAPAPPPKEKTFSKLRILVAEDNHVNQKVALGQLYHLGYRAQAFPNGRELLKALDTTPCDIILMDCQMPEMDGFAATAEIRRREGTARHTIIIAMTANALDGDHDACLAAGMDDHLGKPVKPEALRMMLERWTDPDQRPVLDQAQLTSLRANQLPGSADFMGELIDIYLGDTTAYLELLGKAIATTDPGEIRRLAHLVTGSSANMGATRFAALSEALGHEHPAGKDGEMMAQLEAEFVLVRAALELERATRPAGAP